MPWNWQSRQEYLLFSCFPGVTVGDNSLLTNKNTLILLPISNENSVRQIFFSNYAYLSVIGDGNIDNKHVDSKAQSLRLALMSMTQ